MKKHLSILLCSVCVLVTGGYYLVNHTSFFKKNNNTKNYLLDESFYENIDFDLISDTDYLPAISYAVSEANKNIQAIFDNKDAPTFLNTVVALEESKVLLDRIYDMLVYLADVKNNEEISAAKQEATVQRLEFNAKVFHNKEFFERVKFVYDNQNNFDLDEMDKILLEKTYQTFIKEGVLLNEKDQQTLKEINTQLSKLESEFLKNLQTQEKEFSYNIPQEDVTEKTFEGLQQSSIDSFKITDEKTNKTIYSFTYLNPEIDKVLRDATNRDLRKKIYMMRVSKGKDIDSNIEKIVEGPNAKIVVDVVNLRLKRAKLLGFKNHAEYTLKNTTMADNPENVLKLINDILSKSLKARAKDLKAIEEYAKNIEKKALENKRNQLTDAEYQEELAKWNTFKLEPWDVAYYSKKLKEEKYNLNTEAMEEYFKLSNVREGVFGALNKLYGVSFTKKEKPSLYYRQDKPDKNGKIINGIEEFEVKDQNGEFLGRLYIDYFVRADKVGGAQATSLKEGYAKLDSNGKVIGYNTPVMAVAFNIGTTLKDNSDKKIISSEDDILLSQRRVETFYHEMGHAINGFLIRSKYSSLSFLQSYIDFAELPSQFFENWAFHKDHVFSYAYHYKDTNKVIPKEFIDNMKKAETYNAGIQEAGQMFLNLIDMGWHTIEKEYEGSVESFEKKIFDSKKIPVKDCEIPSASRFLHIMHHGYDAKYYSYTWSLVLAMDAFELFEEKGIFNQDVADSFKDNILSVVSSNNLNEYYKKFRGRDSNTKAFMKNLGFIK